MRQFESYCTAPTAPPWTLPKQVGDDILSAFVGSIGPGGINDNLLTFGLNSPTVTPEEEIKALFLRSIDYAERYAHVKMEGYDVTPCVFDTGASSDLTPFRQDFIDYTPVDLKVTGVTGNGKVAGRGTVLRRFTTRKGEDISLSHRWHIIFLGQRSD